MLRFLMPSRRAATQAARPATHDPDAPYRTDAAPEILQVLRGLRDGATTIDLANDHGQQCQAVLEALDEAACRIVMELPPGEVRRALSAADEPVHWHATAQLDAVRIRFEGDQLLRAGTRLELSWPASVWRFQRRDAFRVQPLAAMEPPTLTLHHPAMGNQADQPLVIADLSVGGCAVRWPHGLPLLPTGTEMRSARLALQPPASFGVVAVVHHVEAATPRGQTSVGIAFRGLHAEGEHALQRWVDNTQRLRRQVPGRRGGGNGQAS